jgi:hypothetical protein
MKKCKKSKKSCNACEKSQVKNIIKKNAATFASGGTNNV